MSPALPTLAGWPRENPLRYIPPTKKNERGHRLWVSRSFARAIRPRTAAACWLVRRRTSRTASPLHFWATKCRVRNVEGFTHQRFPSPYALELLHTHRNGSVLFEGTRDLPPHCPQCDHGLVFKQYSPKNRKWFHACSHRWGCGKTWISWPPIKALARSSGVV